MGVPVAPRADVATQLVVAVTVVSLVGTVTNLLPLSAALALPAGVAPLLLLGRRRVPAVTASLMLMLGYFLIWTVLYSPASMLDYGFFRRDGNVFITFAPLLLLSLLRLDVDVDRLVRFFLYWSAGLNVLFLGIYLVTGGTIFFHQPGIYHFLFYAHNAAGGFLAVTTALCLGYYLTTRERAFLLLTVLNLAGLLATVSRGSVLGLLGAVAIVLVLRGRFTRSFIGAVVIAHLLVVPWLHAAAPPAALQAEHPAIIDSRQFEALPRAHTIAIRAFYLWPRAWDLFLGSPIVGTGFGSYNDLPYRLEGIRGLIQVNRPVEPLYNDSHAHHTFLHVLGETGIVGLLLLCFLLVRLWQAIATLPDESIRLGLQLVFWIAVISSLTEHRLFTPSQMLPFTIILGLCIARREHLRRLEPPVTRWERHRPAEAAAVSEPRSG